MQQARGADQIVRHGHRARDGGQARAIIVSPSAACSSHRRVIGNENRTLFWSSACSVEKRSSSAALALYICR